MRVLEGWEAGEKGGNDAIMLDIFYSKRAKAEEAKPEFQSTGRGGFGPPVCPPYFVTHARQGIFVSS